MEYTHFWFTFKKELPKPKWKAFADDVTCLLARLPSFSRGAGGFYYSDQMILLSGSIKERPIVSDDDIRLNGRGAMAAEEFWIRRKVDVMWPGYGDGRLCNLAFCRTVRKPYDLPVQACLILYQYHFGDLVRVSSSGDAGDWKSAARLTEELFGLTTAFGNIDMQLAMMVSHPANKDASKNTTVAMTAEMLQAFRKHLSEASSSAERGDWATTRKALRGAQDLLPV